MEDPFGGLRDNICFSPDRKALRRSLEWLLEIKPYADLGILLRLPSSFISMTRHPGYVGRTIPKEYDARDREITSPDFRLFEKFDRRIILEHADYTMSTTLAVLGSPTYSGRCHFLARGELEELFSRLLVEQTNNSAPGVDRRMTTVKILAKLDLPDLRPSVDNLLTLRKSGEEFARWRSSLASALAQVDVLRSDSSSRNEDARAIVDSELEPVRASLAKTVKRSPALAAMQSGTTGLVLSGMGALAGAVTGGSLATALAGAATIKLGEFASKYVENRRAQRAGRAVYDLSLSFRD